MPFWRFSASSLWLILLSPNPRLLHILGVFSLSITGGVQDGRNVPLALAGGRGYFWDVFRCSGEPLEKTQGWDSRAQGQGWCGLPGGDAPPSSHASPTGMPTMNPHSHQAEKLPPAPQICLEAWQGLEEVTKTGLKAGAG